MDLIVADFYWPSSYKTYLSGSYSYGKPTLEAIKQAFQKYKVRTVFLDVYSNSTTVGDLNAIPIVKSETLYHNFESLDFYKCLETIKKYAWNDNKYLPLILYLNFNFEDDDVLFNKIYYAIMKVFWQHLIDKKYSFSGRGGIFSAGNIRIIDALGKIIIITNKYPTRTRLDELINGNTTGNSSFVTIDKYSEDQKEYGGLSMTTSKTDLINKYKTNIEFIYSDNSDSSSTIFNSKIDLSNPNFIDCCNYGLQFVMMSLFLPDDNLKSWFQYFKKNKNTIVLKAESLRYIQTVSDNVRSTKSIIKLFNKFI